MSLSAVQFISQTKLGELSAQRQTLRDKLAQILSHASEATGVERLRRLLGGIQDAHLPGALASREMPNLQALAAGANPPQDTVDAWAAQLEEKLEQGGRQADIAYLFGALLGEWDEPEGAATWLQSQAAQHVELLRAVTTDPGHPPCKLLHELLDSLCIRSEELRATIAEHLVEQRAGECDWDVHGPVQVEHQSPEVQAEFRRFTQDDILSSQLQSALRIVARDPVKWEWDASGVATAAIWTRNKWRLYPQLSLIELLKASLLPRYWAAQLGDNYASLPAILIRLRRLAKLEDLGAPEVIVSNEIRMLERLQGMPLFDWYESKDPWDQQPVLRGDERPAGIVVQRAEAQAALRDPSPTGYYGEEAVNPLVHLVHAEVQTLQAARPNAEIHVVTTDIVDFFTSAPHDTLLQMVERLGLPPEGVEKTRQFLQVPLAMPEVAERVDGPGADSIDRPGDAPPGSQRTVAAARGVPMELPYSHWLCEWLLRLLEKHVHQRARVRFIRQVDDICLLAPTRRDAEQAWGAVKEFISDVGLAVNDAKSGYVAIGGESDAATHRVESGSLPSGMPHWGMLALAGDGSWKIHESTLEQFLEDTQRVVTSQTSILASVREYNQQLEFLVRSVGLAMDLGDDHRAAANASIARFEQEAFGGGRRASEAIGEMIARKFGDDKIATTESWMAWPITAGGLGLKLAHIVTGQFQLAYEHRANNRNQKPSELDEHWQHTSDAWSEFYQDQMIKLEPKPCAESARMTRLVERFIARGQRLSGGKQEGLSQYWRWVLSVHGQSILDQFGSFEFLMTHLVPLQLIDEMLQTGRN